MKKIISIVIVVALVLAAVVFVPRLVHSCDNCEKMFLGTGYKANIVSNALSVVSGDDNKIICKKCAESEHALSIAAGKDVSDFRLPLFD